MLANNIIKIGSFIEIPKLIPSEIIISRESVNCKNGHISTNKSNEATEAPALLKSEISRCNDEDANETRSIAKPGNHSQ
tara:strand:- start:464 stop:700 length:237 start_codon:yes stop_codon:yes gene_type:complete